MIDLQTLLYVAGAVLVAVIANSISAVWASETNRWFSPWLLAVILVSPLVFITFGLVTSKVGVAIGSGTIDSLLTVSTVLVGLVLFQEWSKLGLWQYVGLALVMVAIFLMLFTRPAGG